MTNYFIATTGGSNSNNGTSSGSPWLDTTNVNTTAFQGGEIVSFNGGDTIAGGLAIDQTNWGGSNTWDGSHKSTNITLSGLVNNLLVATQSGGGGTEQAFFSTLAKSSGKWVFSVVLTTLGAGGGVIGIGTASAGTTGTYVGVNTQSVGVTTAAGNVILNNATIASGVIASTTTGDRIWVAVDIDAKTIQFAKNNGTWSTTTSIAGLAGFTLTPGASTKTAADVFTADFNSNPPAGISGFLIWNENNPSPANPVVFQSYGTGQATISTGSAGIGVYMGSIGNFTFQNLTFTGPDQTSSKNCFFIWNNIQEDHHLPAFTLSNLTISNYGNTGIYLFGQFSGSGWDNFVISGCTIHHCGGGGNQVNSGIQVLGAGFGAGWTNPSFTGGLITGCLVHTIGTVGTSFPTQAQHGITVGQSLNCTIQLCEVHDTGIGCGNPSQPEGVWFHDSVGCIIQFCETYNCMGGGNGTWSANGLGFDVHCQNCIMQYNYSHDNNGSGALVIAFVEGSPQFTTNEGSVIRYNIFQNNGKNDVDNGVGGEIVLVSGHGNGTSVLTGLKIFNNTCYSSEVHSKGCVVCIGPDFSSTTGNVSNNIFYTTGGPQFINFTFEATETSGSAFLFSGNDYFTSGSFSVTWGASTYTSFAAWVAAVTAQEPSGQRLTNPTVDPLLVSAGTGGTTHGYVPASLGAYKLQSSSTMSGTGLNLNSLYSISPGSQDYFGAAVPSGIGSGYNVGAGGIPLTPSVWPNTFVLVLAGGPPP